MTRSWKCPQCGSRDNTRVGSGRMRCAQCGATYEYRTKWVPLLLTIVILGAVLGAINGLFFENPQRWAVVLIIPFLAVVGLLTRYFRTLHKT